MEVHITLPLEEARALRAWLAYQWIGYNPRERLVDAAVTRIMQAIESVQHDCGCGGSK